MRGVLVIISRQTRNDTPEQQWYLQDGLTHIQLAGTTLCMDGGAESKTSNDRNAMIRD